MSETAATRETLNLQDDLSRGYFNIVEPDAHQGKLSYDFLKSSSNNFSKPVVFRQLAKFESAVTTREFCEVAVDEKLLWREKGADEGVAFRNKEGKTDYNYVSGQEGTATDYLNQIFDANKDVYAHLGKVSSGFSELDKHPWGNTFFNHVREEAFRSNWFDVPNWELSGHCFLGNNTEMFAEPSSGAPGSDWHMFPTVNLFVMMSGVKKWMTHPPEAGDAFKNQEELVFPTGGRECPTEEPPYDTVYLESGDVLFNVPYEWHKVTNAQGPSLGAAFRVIDRSYIDQLMTYPAVKANLKLRKMSEEYAHLATSIHMAANDPNRMQMVLNSAELMVCTAARFDFLNR